MLNLGAKKRKGNAVSLVARHEFMENLFIGRSTCTECTTRIREPSALVDRKLIVAVELST